jgi:ferredoxin/flavodoxin---NADP+ reductase
MTTGRAVSNDHRVGVESLRVAVVGAGPAGIYAAGALLDVDPPVSVDVFDALPAPFGLVRYGVAPDHPKIKSVAAKLAEILASPQARFLGNITFGTDVTADDLARHYHAVIHASGSANERALGIPGEDLSGSFAAADFVAWYNGHPQALDRGFLDARDVVVVGAGNVALDVARMLVTDADALVGTDLPGDVLDAWRAAKATDVHLLARRGPAFAKFTTPELRELADLNDVALVVDPGDLVLDPASEAEIGSSRVAKRNLAVLESWAAEQWAEARRRIHLRFWARPTSIVGTTQVEGVAVERTRLAGNGRLVSAGPSDEVAAQAVFRAIGYAGRPLPGLPFDESTSTVPNTAGRVDGATHPGTYVAGWIKRGPTGVIGTNKSDAAETVRTVLADVPRLPDPAEPDPDAILATLDRAGVRYFNWDDWLALDAYEIASGERIGRPRLKVCTVDEMLRFASGR